LQLSCSSPSVEGRISQPAGVRVRLSALALQENANRKDLNEQQFQRTLFFCLLRGRFRR
jgi:hypothetical protein